MIWSSPKFAYSFCPSSNLISIFILRLHIISRDQYCIADVKAIATADIQGWGLGLDQWLLM